MCFSASSSFTSAALLSIIGIAGTTQVTSKKQYPLAILPFIFVAMQFCEGLVWLAYDYAFYPNWVFPFAGYFFFLVLYYVWPWILPLAFLLPEPVPARKRLLKAIFMLFLMGQGIIVLLTLKNFDRPTIKIINHSIQYAFDLTLNATPTIFLPFCLMLNAVPALVSSLRGTSLLVLITFPAFVFSYIIYYTTFSSVWCFFTAIASSLIYIILYLNKKKPA